MIKKSTILLLFILVGFAGHTESYYISNDGNDLNSGNDSCFPWRSIDRLNLFKAFKDGDTVLFRRGGVFYGSISIKVSGEVKRPVVLSAYGIGTNPKISGFSNLENWESEGSGLYSISFKVKMLNIVLIDNVVRPMGRFPNAGDLQYQSHLKNLYIVSKAVRNSSNWTGSEIVIRKYRWILDRQLITSQIFDTLKYNALSKYGNNSHYEPVDGNGFFIQNSLATLDTLGDWYYNSRIQKLFIYFGSDSPKNHLIRASSQDVNLSIVGQSFVYLENIDFEGGNLQGAILKDCNHVSFKNCGFHFEGGNSVYAVSSSYIDISGGYITNSLNNGICFENNDNNCHFANVSIDRSGLVPGASRSGDAAGEGIFVAGNGTVVRHCIIRNSGYSAISLTGSNILIERNFIDSFCVVKDDGGGIYIYSSTFIKNQNIKIKENVVTNALGSFHGVESYLYERFGKAAAIYIDGATSDVVVDGNTLAHGEWGGIYVNSNSHSAVINNLVYNFAAQLCLNESRRGDIRDIVVTGNRFICKMGTQFSILFHMHGNDNPHRFGVFNGNSCFKLNGDSNVISINRDFKGGSLENMSFTTWRSK